MWQKIKTVQKGKFPAIGFIKDPTGIAALYLGKRQGKELEVGYGMEPDHFQPDQEATGHRGEPEEQAD